MDLQTAFTSDLANMWDEVKLKLDDLAKASMTELAWGSWNKNSLQGKASTLGEEKRREEEKARGTEDR